MPLPLEGPNAEQITYWNQQAGPTWVAVQASIDQQIRPLGRLAMDRAGLRPGLRVLDVGCGCGDTTIELAARVAPGGEVLGVDISAPMLTRAGQQARAANVTNARFEIADAQIAQFPAGAFDVLFSRFGVMFFADPAAAFANLRSALRAGGQLAFACWQSMMDNPWMTVPMAAALQHLPPPPIPAPGAPGPFAFADPDHVRGILEAAGFTAVALEPVRMTLSVGGGQDLDATVDFLLRMGPTARALREADDPELPPLVAASVREALRPYQTAAGVQMDSASWIVTARS
ncbi:methyltransferase domain-containing protein [bacterium]|nr:methyltransferase domain-containing protein [bacterium]